MTTSAPTSLPEILHHLGIALPLLSSLGFGDGLPLYFTDFDGDPLEIWKSLRSVVKQTQYWPLLTWDEALLRDRQEWPQEDVRELWHKMAEFDAEAWLRNQVQHLLDTDDRFREGVAAASASLEPNPYHAFRSLYHMRTHKSEATSLLLVPTTESWQVPLHLCFGNFNHCPSPEVHASVLRYWQRLYQAELVSMAHDALGLLVLQPPQRPSDGLRLAMEQFGYCEDVEEVTWSVEDLASHLIGGTTWYFWWD